MKEHNTRFNNWSLSFDRLNSFAKSLFWRNLEGERNGKTLNNDNNPKVTHCNDHI